ncbi:MAG: hypothetical protein V2I26_17215 [Halieaceae bacterium]|nr:hypothetical protein [Halieaceae bacterium]
MSVVPKRILAPALVLILVLASTAPASARPGIWVYLREGDEWTISLINLTQYPLLIAENSFSLYCLQGSLPYRCEEYTSNPFQGHGALNLDPYRTAIWKSGDARSNGGFAWSGHLAVKPEGMDTWQLSLNTHTESPEWSLKNTGKGTWVNLQTDLSETGNPGWSRDWSSFAYGIWVTPDFVDDYTHMENVMTLSGTEFAVSLYSNNFNRVTLVFRETSWDGSQGDDYVGWELNFVDNAANSVP